MRGRHTEVAEGLDDMREDEPPGGGEDVRPRSKHGAGKLLPGTGHCITLWLMHRQVRQLDSMAGEIRAAGGIWITRSAMITAFIEAALRSEPLLDVLTSQSRRIRKPSLMVRNPPQPEERHATPGKRLVRMAKYLLRKRSSHFKLEDGV
jgi:hypothetical protein